VTTFLWVMLVVHVLDTITHVFRYTRYRLEQTMGASAKADAARRNAELEIINILACVGVCVWAAFLLGSMP
jgi:hypothetical protein